MCSNYLATAPLNLSLNTAEGKGGGGEGEAVLYQRQQPDGDWRVLGPREPEQTQRRTRQSWRIFFSSWKPGHTPRGQSINHQK